jgi:hypothetical protein
MFNLKIIPLILLVAASAIASLLIYQRANATILDRATLLQQQSQQIARLQTEQQHLSNLVAAATDAPAPGHSAELAKLRAEAEALRKQTNELSQQSKLHPAPQSARPAPAPENHTPEYWEQLHQTAGNKGGEAMELARAMTDYAMDHQKQFPSSLDQLAPYLAKNHATLSGTNHFEIVYQGSLDELDGIPENSIAGLRETQTWLSPDGKPTRVYGLIPGSGQTVSSDDNFQSWEADHVISSSPAQSSR